MAGKIDHERATEEANYSNSVGRWADALNTQNGLEEKRIKRLRTKFEIFACYTEIILRDEGIRVDVVSHSAYNYYIQYWSKDDLQPIRKVLEKYHFNGIQLTKVRSRVVLEISQEMVDDIIRAIKV